MVEKGSELADSDPNRKLKGLVVFLGDRVKDADGKHAVFEELSSSPAAMSAGKFADAYGCMPGNILQTADGIQAYPQARMSGKVKLGSGCLRSAGRMNGLASTIQWLR